MTEFLVVTGLSGAGRSTAANVLEDRGWFKIDNLPPQMVAGIVDLMDDDPATERVALGVGSGGHAGQVADAIGQLKKAAGADHVRCIFVDASTDVLVRRYESTRRRHPRDDGRTGLAEVIERERALLAPARAEADAVIDTTDLSVHELRRRIVERFGSERDAGMSIGVLSFGYKYGLPRDVDIVLDCRFLPNPHWQDELRPLTGRDAPVRDFVLGQPEAGAFLDAVEGMVVPFLPAFEDEGKAYLSVAIGCTGGRHRSVAIADALAERITAAGYRPTVTHRDADR